MLACCLHLGYIQLPVVCAYSFPNVAGRFALSTGATSSSTGASSLGGEDDLKAAIGVGMGKHAGAKRRIRRNKYADASKDDGGMDPWDRELQRAKDIAVDAVAEREREESKARRREEKRVPGEVEFPDEVDIDPYDPATFGYTEVGYVMGAHGLRGEVKVRCTSDFGNLRLCTPGERHLRSPERRFPRSVRLLAGRIQVDDVYIVRFMGAANRDEAAALKDHVIYIRDAQAPPPPLEDGEFLVSDLVGLKVYTDRGRNNYVGEVVGVVVMNDVLGEIAGRFTDLLELELPPLLAGGPRRQCYIPMAPSIVPDIDTEQKWCRVVPPQGLLELAVEKEERVAIRGLLPP